MLKQYIKRTEIEVRTRLPDWVRGLYRLSRSLGAVPQFNAMPTELLEECRFCASRVEMLKRLPSGGIVAELGTYLGDFARVIRDLNKPRSLHLIDIDDSHFNTDGLEDASVIRHLGFTHEVIAAFPDAFFDWIYIDADHSYAGCLRDAKAAAPKVKPGGYLAFNDFAHIDPWLGRYGVGRAVVDFAIEKRWPMAFFCYEPSGLYDVSFRRPLDA